VSHLSIGEGFYTCPGRHLGDGAALLGDLAGARAYYSQALEAAGKIRFRPELALTHLGMAEILFVDGDYSAAQQHFNLALPELLDMHMQPALERALALSHKLEPAPGPDRHGTSASDSLTRREREIAILMAEALSNHEIAERLVINEGTVEVHVKHILAKLGLRSRTQVAAWFAGQHTDPGPDQVNRG
jgi:DNA-binding CsgD family transcriptional regulator